MSRAPSTRKSNTIPTPITDEPANRKTTPSTVPTNWPTNIAYLKEPIFTKTIPEALIGRLRIQKSSLTTPSFNVPKIPNPLVHILPITDPSHPAYGQNGLFATHHLIPDTFILPYLGVVHANTPADTNPTSDYDLSFDRELGLSVDAALMGNEARFINDYRGVPGTRNRGPNAEFRDCWLEIGNGVVERRIGVFVVGAGKSGKRKEGIKSGEEVLVSYGKGFWMGRAAANVIEADGHDEDAQVTTVT